MASHAQKYFIRLNSQNKKDKRRASIHDITTVAPAGSEHGGIMSQMPITGQVRAALRCAAVCGTGCTGAAWGAARADSQPGSPRSAAPGAGG